MKSASNFNILNIVRRLVLLGLLIGYSYFIKGQASEVNPLNDNVSIDDFLGWGPSVNSDVLIRHRTENQPIIFSTDGVDGFFFRRMEY